jgi:hypothetical protein
MNERLPSIERHKKSKQRPSQREINHRLTMPPMNSESEGTLSAVQTLLARDLNKISLNEREKVYEDLHGVSGLVDESPELVASCLAQLESGIAKLRGKKAYNIAAAIADSSYTSSRALRLQFLRADNFDAKKAAARLVVFLENKLELFGPDPLARDLLRSDLSEEDQKCLQSGLMTLVPEKDKAGRGIMTWMPMLKGGFSVGSKVRVANIRAQTGNRCQISVLNVVIVISLHVCCIYRCAV